MLIVGSGALRIGQAGEFDYSGSQALKAFKEEGVRTILVNPNVATIQTTPGMADAIYLLPVEPDVVTAIIEKERPEAILLSVGGQSGLNLGLELWKDGTLEKYGVRILGTPVETIEETEDRERFAERMRSIDVPVPESRTAESIEEAVEVATEIGYPAMVRAAFSLGGLASGVVENEAQMRARAAEALAHVDQVLVEEYLSGWKELEYEVVRDRFGNAVTVCNMENMDPMGVHTGESIVIAPSVTLTNDEYHAMRSMCLRIVEELGVIGECNVQFAVNPATFEVRVIEMNARLSRSSALASKATGYPLAWVATKLALGANLAELKNAVTGVTGCFFEPALDYVTVKIPRWDLQKFKAASRRIGTEMKSVGEVMAIGASFEEALQKAVRSLGLGYDGLTDPAARVGDPMDEIRKPTDRRLYALANAFADRVPLETVRTESLIDPWFLGGLRRIAEAARRIEGMKVDALDAEAVRDLKRLGFSDAALARHMRSEEALVRSWRKQLGVVPQVRRIDTLAGEFPAATNYLYTTYAGVEHEVQAEEQGRPVIVIGSGPYCIGSSVEFDWCSVGAARTAAALGHRTILINCNPETVSTDFDSCDRLYFEELTLERLLDVVDHERPLGVIVSVGGQIPNNLAPRLAAAGVQLLGTRAEDIDRAENRHRFSAMLDELGVDQPAWQELSTAEDATRFASEVGYPVLVRPSYVLSGAAMNIAKNEASLRQYLSLAASVSKDNPVVVSKFIEGAKEIEVDGVAQDGELVLYAISEHVELSGVHSGDATLVLPPQRTWLETIRRTKRITKAIARGLRINGPFNVQLLAKENSIRVIECNLRASRSFPFVSKATGYDFIEVATRAMLGEDARGDYQTLDLDHVAVKAPQFSFSRLKGADPVLYVEMTSTGEVACFGDSLEEAWWLATRSVGFRLPERSVLLSIGGLAQKEKLLPGVRALAARGIAIFATAGTHEFLREAGVTSVRARKHSEPSEASGDPSVLELIQGKRVDCVINVPTREVDVATLTDGYHIRRSAADLGISLVNDAEIARLLLRVIEAGPAPLSTPRSLEEFAFS